MAAAPPGRTLSPTPTTTMPRLLNTAVLLTLALPVLASAATLDRLRGFIRDTQTARTSFTQTVTDKAGRVVQRSSGEFMLARPGKFRWAVDKPYRQLVVGDGERVWIFDEDLNQVVVRKAGEAIGGTPAALLAGRDDVERAFTWRELPSSGGLEWIAATPRNKDAAFEEIRLGFNPKSLAALELTDAFGQKTAVRFGELDRNPSLAPETFRFVAPKGADVIGDK